MPMTIDGLDLFLDKFSDKLLRDAKQNVAAALYQRGEKIMSVSKQIVPVLTGALMNTGKVTLPVEDGSGVIEVTVGYGDESVGYALYVHEELNAPSGGPIKYTRPGSGPKYLERPALEQAGELSGDVRDALMKAFTS
jgi:hypothetical protein